MARKKQQTLTVLRIRLKSYDHRLVDKVCRQIIDLVITQGGEIRGPVPLPTERRLFTVQRSPFIYKDSREQFEIKIHKRLIDIVNPDERIIENLNSLDLPAGVEAEIKLMS